MTFGMDVTQKSFQNLVVSYRGSERQPPNCLQLCLRFSRLMEVAEAEGRHQASMGTEDRLRAIVQDFHDTSGLATKHQLDEDKEAREVMRSHLDRFKWKEAAYNTEQLRSQRWMIGSQPKANACPPELRKVLCVTNQSQVMHLKLVAYCFAEESRRLRASARARVRLSSEQFDAFADFACFYSAVLTEARLLSTWTPEKEEAVMKSFYQKFCTSVLWIRQSLAPANFPPALNEKDFVIPGSGAETFQCNDARRNLTDQQETSQWCGGIMVPKQAWKAGQKPMDQHTPRYKAKPSEEDLPKTVKPPELKCCQIVGEKLVLPSDVRSMFLTCPVFGPEWRELLTTFDKQWAAPVGTPAPKSSPIKKETVKDEKTETKQETKEEGDYDWKAAFPGEPVTYEEVKKKHGEDQCTEIPGGVAGLLLVLAPGPSLYVVGKAAAALDINTPFITHGPGTWLLGDKASKYMQNNPGKGFACQWTDDSVPVCVEESKFECCFVSVFCLEEDGGDTPVMTLREALQNAEKGGFIDYTVWRLRKYVTEKCIAAAKPLWPVAPEETTPEKKENQFGENLDGKKVSCVLNRGKSSAFLGENMEIPEENLSLGMSSTFSNENPENQVNGEDQHVFDDAKTELDGLSPKGEVVDLAQDSPIEEYFQESQEDHGEPVEPVESFEESQPLEESFYQLATDEKEDNLDSMPELEAPDSVVPDHPVAPMADLAMPDLASPDLAMPDQPQHDLAMPNEPAPASEPIPETPAPEVPRRNHTEDQLFRKRASSRAWHAKWEKKGVPKRQRIEVPENAPAPPAPPAVIREPGSFNNLMEARDYFIRDWIAHSDLPPSNERRAAATSAWMASQLRADVMAARSGIQN
eukprot:s74_g17.t1